MGCIVSHNSSYIEALTLEYNSIGRKDATKLKWGH